MKNKLALILDDNEQKAELISIWLSQYGVDSNIVKSYDEAMTHTSIRYDYIIVDYFLDGKNIGTDFTDLYKKMNSGCHVWLYSAFPEKIESTDDVIDFSRLRDFLTAKLKPKEFQLDFFPSDIYVVNQEESFDQINNLSSTVKSHHGILNKHDNKLIEIETALKNLKKLLIKYRNIGLIVLLIFSLIIIYLL